jgi:hypothetical protein
MTSEQLISVSADSVENSQNGGNVKPFKT